MTDFNIQEKQPTEKEKKKNRADVWADVHMDKNNK